MTDKPPSSRLCCPKNLQKKVYNFFFYHPPQKNDLAFRSPSMSIKFSRNRRDRCIQSKISRCTQTNRGEKKKRIIVAKYSLTRKSWKCGVEARHLTSSSTWIHLKLVLLLKFYSFKLRMMALNSELTRRTQCKVIHHINAKISSRLF